MKRAAILSLVPVFRLMALVAPSKFSFAPVLALLLLGCSDRAVGAGPKLHLLHTDARANARALALRQADASPEYRVAKLGPGRWSATHPQMQLDSRFEPGRVSLLSTSASEVPPTPIELAALAWGCESALQGIPVVAPTLDPQHPGAIRYRHSDFDEWYLPGPLGLEQGFTIRALPACAQRGEPLQIRLALGEAVAAASATDGDALLLATGARTVHYGQAFAEDASGEEAPVRIRTSAGLVLELDVSNRPLPISVDPLAWVEQQKLSASDGSDGDAFGKAIAVSGDTLLVGAYGDDDLGTDAGSAYVYVRTLGVWTVQQKLTAGDGAAGDAFGYAVALNGDTAVVGAYLADAAGADSGAAYVFTRSGSTWTRQAKLVAADAAAGDHLAASLAISGQTLLLGAPLKNGETAKEAGAAYTFSQNNGAWSQQAKLAPSHTPGDHTGAGVAISGNNLTIGTARANGYAVSFYTFDGNSWNAAGNVSSNNSTFAYYGSALAMSGTYTVIGSYAHPFGPSAVNGTVVVVSNASHSQQYSLRANDGSINDLFGRAVAISDANLIVVGSPQDDDQGEDSGSAFVFAFNENGWSQRQKLLASAGKAGDGFGAAVAVTADAALIGAWQGGSTPGRGLVYSEVLHPTGGACLQSSECESGFCVEGVCCTSSCSGVCQSCLQKNKAANGGVDGVCGSVKRDADPRDSCPDSGAGSCGTTGLCDGKGACSVRANGTSCSFTACAGRTSSTLSSACNGSGDCKPTATVPCQLGYACVLGTCRSGCQADSDCDANLGFICTEAGVCKQPKGVACTSDANCSTGSCQYGHCCLADAEGACIKPLGIPCALASECASGSCTDGVCCSSACGTCQSCAIAGNFGQCASLASAPPDTPGSAACAAGGKAGATGDGSSGDFSGGSAGFADGGLAGSGGQSTPLGGTGGTAQTGGAGGSMSTAAASGSVGGPAGIGQGGASGGGDGISSAASPSNRAGGAGTVPIGASGNAGALALGCSTDSDCAPGLGCDPRSHTCRDQLVTACGCRVAGERSVPKWSLVFCAMACWVGSQRRKRHRWLAISSQPAGASRSKGSRAPRRSSEAISS